MPSACSCLTAISRPVTGILGHLLFVQPTEYLKEGSTSDRPLSLDAMTIKAVSPNLTYVANHELHSIRPHKLFERDGMSRPRSQSHIWAWVLYVFNCAAILMTGKANSKSSTTMNVTVSTLHRTFSPITIVLLVIKQEMAGLPDTCAIVTYSPTSVDLEGGTMSGKWNRRLES